MSKYVVGSKILKKNQVLISIAVVVLLLAASFPVKASSGQNTVQKTVVSGIPSWESSTVATDYFGNLYYVVNPAFWVYNSPCFTPLTCNMAYLYELPVGSHTPKLLFTESYPSAAYVFIGWLSFDVLGDVNFLTTQIYPTDSSGNAVINTQANRLGALDHRQALLYSASMTSNCGFWDTGCIAPGGDTLVSLATNLMGDVAIGAARYCSTCTIADGYVINVPLIGSPSVRVDLGDVYMGYEDAYPAAIDNRGDFFTTLYSASVSAWITDEVTASGKIVVLSTTTADVSDFTWFITTDFEGNVFLLQRTVTAATCGGVATSTTVTIEEFTWTSLLGSSPAGTVTSTETYPGYNYVIVGNNDQFRASVSGTLYYVLYPSTMASCSSPISWNVIVYGLKPGAAHPVVVASENNPPNVDSQGAVDISSLAASYQGIYYSSSSAGSVFLVKSW
jgi:hypothetical protein